MPSIRQFYFENIHKVEASKNISKPQFLRLISLFNKLQDEKEIFLHFDDEMKGLEDINLILKDVFDGKMLEYLTNEAYFLGDYYYVNEKVLIPRQETEELVDYFCKFVNKNFEDPTIADICTGSGCIAVASAKRIQVKAIYASDLSDDAIEVAKINNEKFKTNITFFKGNIVDPIIFNDIKLDCLICNPPYIKDSSTIDERTWNYEPHEALISDPDTYFYEYILERASKIMKDKHLIAFEIGEDMKDALLEIAKKYLPLDKIDFIKDMESKWRFMFIYSDPVEIASKAAEILKKHGVIAFPTETVMGLGVAYDDEIAFEKLNKVKGRPENKPYSLMLGNKEDISKYAYISKEEQKVINAFLPGPLTILLKKKNLPRWVTLDSEYVGIRVPNLPIINSVINTFGKPILAPSANRSGDKPALTSKEVENIFGNELDLIIPGDASNELASTIVKIDNGVQIIRQGIITKEQIEEVLNKTMKIAIGNDHAGYKAKISVMTYLENQGYKVFDCGSFNEERCDYPDFAKAVGAKVINKVADFGILICGSGEGISIAANKIKGIRCGIAYNDEVAKLMKQHNDANVIAFGARFMTVDQMIQRINIFMSATFEGGRHTQRVEKIEN